MSLLDALLEDLEKSFADLEEAIDGLTHEQLVTVFEDEWSVRDALGHIVGWHHEMDDALERIARGERPVPEGLDYSDSECWRRREPRVKRWPCQCRGWLPRRTGSCPRVIVQSMPVQPLYFCCSPC